MIRKAVKLKKGKIVTKPLKNDGAKIDFLVTAMKDMKMDISDINVEMGGMRTDINSLKSIKATLEEVKMRGDATFEEVGKIRVEISEMNMRFDNIESELASIKNEIKELRMSLTAKADIERLQKLDERVFRIERHMKLSLA